MKLKQEIGKLQFIFDYGEDYTTTGRHNRIVQFGILKLKKIPNDCEIVKKEHYSGFIIRVFFLIPFFFRINK